ncbi:hypothetical protein E2562_015980 [Oryza meyeriana var. granulata]|uniref:Single-stranded DNA-binding protein n=1 Tax=Oryza meyeriana var. granulata TaxID=110450 RepID=A0A6G1ELG6_9ORYZ|nr:hypothetical protein E2562_015980 [Oryza meyeriana var. granulata]
MSPASFRPRSVPLVSSQSQSGSFPRLVDERGQREGLRWRRSRSRSESCSCRALHSHRLRLPLGLQGRISHLGWSYNFPPRLVIYHEFSQHWIAEGLQEDLRTANKTNWRELEPQSVDPKKGWGFRGVHRAIICGKVGQVPVQKILRNGRTVTVFTVGTGGMFDQRVVGDENLPKPAQWHRIAVHNDQLGAFAVQKLVKNSAVYVEGDIETRIYNDSINDQVKNIPEICLRRDGKIRLMKSGESAASISLDELSKLTENLNILSYDNLALLLTNIG